MTEDNSLKIAVQVLKEQKAFPVDDLVLSCKNDILTITGWTKCFYLENVTKANALQDLLLTKEKFNSLLKKSIELSDYAKDKQIEYSLSFDYGKGGVGLCEEIDGQVTWLHKMT